MLNKNKRIRSILIFIIIVLVINSTINIFVYRNKKEAVEKVPTVFISKTNSQQEIELEHLVEQAPGEPEHPRERDTSSYLYFLDIDEDEGFMELTINGSMNRLNGIYADDDSDGTDDEYITVLGLSPAIKYNTLDSEDKLYTSTEKSRYIRVDDKVGEILRLPLIDLDLTTLEGADDWEVTDKLVIAKVHRVNHSKYEFIGCFVWLDHYRDKTSLNNNKFNRYLTSNFLINYDKDVILDLDYKQATSSPVNTENSNNQPKYIMRSYEELNNKMRDTMEENGYNNDQSKIVVKAFNYIVDNFKYDYELVDSGANRIYREITVEEILDTNKGVCLDFSILFASILRSHDIPTKVVTGYYRKINERGEEDWEGHAWNEVYLGDKWLKFDTTHDKFQLDEDSEITENHIPRTYY